jgi:hypothetical protein
MGTAGRWSDVPRSVPTVATALTRVDDIVGRDRAASWSRRSLARALLHSPGAAAGRPLRHDQMVRRRRVRPPAPVSEFVGFRFPPEVIVLGVRWYLRFALSYRDVEELLAERGLGACHDDCVSRRWTRIDLP